MKKLIVISLLASNLIFSNAQAVQENRFDLQALPVGQIVQLVYSEAFKSPYVLAPEVLKDERPVSFRFEGSQTQVKAFMKTFLQELGYETTNTHGVDFIKTTKKQETKPEELETFIYHPKYRSVNYLARILEPLFQGKFTNNRTLTTPLTQGNSKEAPEGSAAALVDQGGIDSLIFSGTQKEITKLEKLLNQVDFQQGEILVRGVVYEVSTTEKDQSAFGILANLLNTSIGIGETNPIGSFIKLKNNTLNAVYSLLSQDSRFNIVSSPSLRIQSGASGSFSVGQEVPTLGNVSYTTNGQPVQSVEYRQSGVLFDIQPQVKENVIDLAINQQLSNFITTTTGVNNTPTLTKRELKTVISAQDGDLIVLGGLTENKDGQTKDGLRFLPTWLHSKGKDTSKTEVLLVLEVNKI